MSFNFQASTKESAQIITKLRCAAGLSDLAGKKYKTAARYFLQANFDHCDFSDMLSPNNVALYGGLCALATFDREELQKHVISSRFVLINTTNLTNPKLIKLLTIIKF